MVTWWDIALFIQVQLLHKHAEVFSWRLHINWFETDKISVFEDKHKYVIINNYMYKNKYEQMIQSSRKLLQLFVSSFREL